MRLTSKGMDLDFLKIDTTRFDRTWMIVRMCFSPCSRAKSYSRNGRENFFVKKFIFYQKTVAVKIRSAFEERGEETFSPFNSHPYLLSRPLSLLITDRKSLFFTDKNQYHISTHLVRETRRHKKHFPPPNTPPRYIFESHKTL